MVIDGISIFVDPDLEIVIFITILTKNTDKYFD